MRIRWYGQSAFALTGTNGTRIFLDPFAEFTPEIRAARPGMQFDYAPIRDVEADLLLVTHEHIDHNGVEAVVGSPHLVRSTAGTLETPHGTVIAIASEHDAAAGTERGPNSIYVFSLDGLRIAHFGDFGQAELRPAQQAAIGEIDVLFLPVGGGPTTGGEPAAEIVRALRPRLVVAMHYGNEAVNFLSGPEPFLEALPEARVERLASSEAEAEDLLGERDAPVVVIFAPPLRTV
jgi:L-ascorbate metabolism protein UlaG (beta-lactamase superfamily)